MVAHGGSKDKAVEKRKEGKDFSSWTTEIWLPLNSSILIEQNNNNNSSIDFVLYFLSALYSDVVINFQLKKNRFSLLFKLFIFEPITSFLLFLFY